MIPEAAVEENEHMIITEFLEARIAEDEAAAHEEDKDYADTTLLPAYDSKHQAIWNTSRVLAECVAKLAIADEHAAVRDENWMSGKDHDYLFCASCGSLDDAPVPYPCATLEHLAAVYADHPDYKQEWAL